MLPSPNSSATMVVSASGRSNSKVRIRSNSYWVTPAKSAPDSRLRNIFAKFGGRPGASGTRF
jgi:hypothetical protein